MHAKEGGGEEVECVGRQERYFTRWVIYVREVQHWCLGAFENRWSQFAHLVLQLITWV